MTNNQPTLLGFIDDADVAAVSFIDGRKRPSETILGGFQYDPILNRWNIGDFANVSVLIGLWGATVHTDPAGLGTVSVLPVAAGAQVGLPTASAGTGSVGVSGSLHRHAFSGRFSKNGFIRDASLGGALPAKFTRIISNNNWTLRRISVYALTAPAGTGSDTYGVVNAAGTLQGTAVSLAVGAVENATALQVTNLTGGTVYYIATTARATTPALDVNVELEYTMNV